MSWTPHLNTGEDALLPSTRKTLGILKHIGRSIPSKSKKLLAEGLILSQLRYLISIWGGTTESNLTNTQTLLNDTARFITNKNRRTSTLELMTDCGWLTVSEMIQHCSLILLWKTLNLNSPNAMRDKIELNNENYVITNQPRLMHTTWSWRWRTTDLWNTLPGDIRGSELPSQVQGHDKDLDNISEKPPDRTRIETQIS